MAHVDTDEHSALCIKSLRKLKMVQISPCLGINLTKDVCSFRQVELGAIASRYDLRRNAILKHDFFESLIIIFALEHANNHRWVTEHLFSHHVLAQLFV